MSLHSFSSHAAVEVDLPLFADQSISSAELWVKRESLEQIDCPVE
jgi:hypothetical protein